MSALLCLFAFVLILDCRSLNCWETEYHWQTSIKDFSRTGAFNFLIPTQQSVGEKISQTSIFLFHFIGEKDDSCTDYWTIDTDMSRTTRLDEF